MPRQGCGVGAKLELRALSEPEVVDKYTVAMAWGVHLGQRGARTQALPRCDAAQPAAQVLQAQVPVTSPRTPLRAWRRVSQTLLASQKMVELYRPCRYGTTTTDRPRTAKTTEQAEKRLCSFECLKCNSWHRLPPSIQLQWRRLRGLASPPRAAKKAPASTQRSPAPCSTARSSGKVSAARALRSPRGCGRFA